MQNKLAVLNRRRLALDAQKSLANIAAAQTTLKFEVQSTIKKRFWIRGIYYY